MQHTRSTHRGKLAALALLAAATLAGDRPATALSCESFSSPLTLISVTEDGLPRTAPYDASLSLFNRGPGVVEIVASPGSGSAFWRETYHVAPAPGR